MKNEGTEARGKPNRLRKLGKVHVKGSKRVKECEQVKIARKGVGVLQRHGVKMRGKRPEGKRI